MNSIKVIIAITLLLPFAACNVHIKNATTDSVKIQGNCEMCESHIEKAGYEQNVAEVDWNQNSKIAIITYDARKTNPDEILKRIALAGFDSENFLAPDDAYANLPSCCQYERLNKSEAREVKVMEDHSKHNNDGMTAKTKETKGEVSKLTPVFDTYFSLKDALVKSDGNMASAKAKALLNALNKIQMNELSSKEHNVWMKVMVDLSSDTKNIGKTNDLISQRINFITLSDNVYQLLKVSEQESPSYYQHCPMANEGKGANWLSKENAIKNPYFGSTMLTCGKTIETID